MPEHYFFSLKEDLLGGETVGEDGIVLALAGCAFPFPLAAGALSRATRCAGAHLFLFPLPLMQASLQRCIGNKKTG